MFGVYFFNFCEVFRLTHSAAENEPKPIACMHHVHQGGCVLYVTLARMRYNAHDVYGSHKNDDVIGKWCNTYQSSALPIDANV